MNEKNANTTKPATKKVPPTKPEKKAKPESNRYTRVHAFCDALKRGGTMKEITAEYMKLCEAKGSGKKQSEATAGWVVSDFIKPLIQLKFVTKDKDGRYGIVTDERRLR